MLTRNVFAVIPAVDLLGESAVRLKQGAFDRVVAREADPAALVERFAAAGAGRIHLVDLDGARTGLLRPALVGALVARAAPALVQASGGVRSPADARSLRRAGADRVVVGTAAFARPDALERFGVELGDALVVAIDVRAGRVVTRGWEVDTELTVDEAIDRCLAAGVPRLLCTAVDRDGTLAGPDLALLARVVERSGLPVLAAGGIRSEDDLRVLENAGCEAAVVGRALLEERVPLTVLGPRRVYTRSPMAITESTWTPSSWRAFPALQQPDWPDEAALVSVRERLGVLPPLVFAGEARTLLRGLGEASAGRAFVLQAGDCAESFRNVSAVSIRERLKVLLQMSAVLTYGATLPVVKVGRIAGQFTKPRTSPTETVDGVELPAFRGHAIHSDEPTLEARTPDPERMVHAYYQAVSTLNLLRAFTKGGFADLAQVHTWNQEFVASSTEGRRYETIANEIGRALRFMSAIGIDLGDERTIHEVDVWTSHEALLLDFEEPLVRKDSTTGDWYACSAHFLWLGERTRGLDGAHVEFLSGVLNPVGSKIGPAATPDDVVALCERLNPRRIPGRLTLITRLGAGRVRALLPPLLQAVRESEVPVVWVCDPMHANTFFAPSGHKTRRFDDVMAELEGFFAAHREVGTWPGGIHVEITGEDVTECLGGSEAVSEEQLDHRYETLCDPRLNVRQSLDLAFRVAESMRAV